MASIIKRLLLASFACYSSVALASEAALKPEQVDAHSLNAYESFWQTFEHQQQQLLDEGQKKYQKNWRQREASHHKEKALQRSQKITILKDTAAGYRQQLESYPKAENRPIVLLNLAQVLLLLGEQQAAGDEDGGSYARLEGIAVLDELKTHYRYFARIDEAFYLQGILYTALNKKEEALGVWRELAKMRQQSRFVVYAHVALGDYFFAGEDPYVAIKQYDQAAALLARLGKQQSEGSDRLLIAYRLAWAAYRGGALAKVIAATKTLLSPQARLRNTEVFARMQLDAVQLLGDALCESMSIAEISRLLTGPELGLKAPAVGAHALQRLGGVGQHRKVVALGQALVQAHPLAAEFPNLVTLLAASYKQSGQTNAYMASLEKILLLLPKNSLWRSHHKRSLATIQQMEGLATQAGLVAAVWNYDKGVNSGSARYFLTAASFYRMLLDFAPEHASSKEWRLRLAHCYYFAASYDEAAIAYADLVENYKLEPPMLEMASYQLVLTSEKKWRTAYSQSLERGAAPGGDPLTTGELQKLLTAIDGFAGHFPKQARTVDLLLIGAGACRDGGDLAKAREFWQKALVAEPSTHQRSIALRGVVFSYVKHGSAGELVATLRRFLRLENWQQLGKDMHQEFLTVLSRAAFDEGKRLSDGGQLVAGGTLLTQLAAEFEGLPARSKLYRDGAYMLAIAGQWAAAQQAASKFLQTKLRQQRGDMVYLLARSYEYQLRFTTAAGYYYQLAHDYPQHARAATSLDRAQQLALAEDEYELAGTAGQLAAKRATKPSDRIAALSKAVTAFQEAKAFDKALTLAGQRLAASKTAADKLSSQLLIAKANLAAGQSAKAAAVLGYLVTQANEWREQLGEEAWSELRGEAQFLLGDEAKAAYQKVDLWRDDVALTSLIKRKLQSLAAVHQHWYGAGQTAHPLWASRSRYQLAELTEHCADELASVSQRGGDLSPAQQKSYRSQIDQLRTNAKELHSRNLIAHTKDPRLGQNTWIQKSSLRLAGRRGTRSYQVESQLPHAIHFDLPYQWSL